MQSSALLCCGSNASQHVEGKAVCVCGLPSGISPTSKSWTWASGTWSTECWTTSRAGSSTTSWTFTSRRAPSTCAATVRASSTSRVESAETRVSRPEAKRYTQSVCAQFSLTAASWIRRKESFFFFLGSVCEEAESVHPVTGYWRPEGVDKSDEENHPDSWGSRRALRTVEGPERDRCSEYRDPAESVCAASTHKV